MMGRMKTRELNVPILQLGEMFAAFLKCEVGVEQLKAELFVDNLKEPNFVI